MVSKVNVLLSNKKWAKVSYDNGWEFYAKTSWLYPTEQTAHDAAWAEIKSRGGTPDGPWLQFEDEDWM